MPFAAAQVADDPEELDVLFAASKHSLPRLLRACETDLGLCTGFPWRITAEAIAVPPLGIVNGHPSLLPRYRGPFLDDDTEEILYGRFPELSAELLREAFDRLARGDRGDPQGPGENQGPFEQAYRFVDLTRPAAEVHRQVRAWSFVPPIGGQGPMLDGVRLVRTSLVEVESAERLECADGPLWVVESETVSDTSKGV